MPQKYTSSTCDRSYSKTYLNVVSTIVKEDTKDKAVEKIATMQVSGQSIGTSTANQLYDLLKK